MVHLGAASEPGLSRLRDEVAAGMSAAQIERGQARSMEIDASLPKGSAKF